MRISWRKEKQWTRIYLYENSLLEKGMKVQFSLMQEYQKYFLMVLDTSKLVKTYPISFKYVPIDLNVQPLLGYYLMMWKFSVILNGPAIKTSWIFLVSEKHMRMPKCFSHFAISWNISDLSNLKIPSTLRDSPLNSTVNWKIYTSGW